MKHKRRIRGSLQYELYRIFYKIIPNDILQQYQTYVKIICGLLKINNIPELRWCDSSRQGECIRNKNGKNPCGGACYNWLDKPVIYLRNHYISQDLLLHEIFHHVNRLNSGIQEKIMWNWLLKENDYHKTDFRKIIKEILEKK